jgi:hypothetical protein
MSLQVIGALIISAGAALIFVPAGLVVAGAFVIAFGVAIERTR